VVRILRVIINYKGDLPMKKSIAYAKDQYISIAYRLAHNLVIHANSSRGKFELQFFSFLNNKQLDLLKKFAEEQNVPQVFLEFSTIPSGSTERPKEFENFSQFDWENVSEIQICRSQPYLDHTDTPSKNYVRVVLVTKS